MKELAFSGFWYYLIVMAVASYLIGCFNFAVLLAKARHKDVRAIGSGNPGTMNISREFGLKVGFANFILDVCKGGIPVLVSYLVFRSYVFAGTDVVVSDFTRYFCGVFVVIGHIYPVTMKFRGGKGIASTLGLFYFGLACESPWYIFAATAAFIAILAFIALTEWGSMGSLIGVAGLALFQALLFLVRYEAELACGWVAGCFLCLVALVALTWSAHRKNLVRLFAGEEHRTSVRKLLHGKRGMN